MTLLLLFLSKSPGGHVISFQIKPWVAFGLPYLLIELFYIGIPVVRTDGRSPARSVYDQVITKFSRIGKLPHFLSYGAPSTRGANAQALREPIGVAGQFWKRKLRKALNITTDGFSPSIPEKRKKRNFFRHMLRLTRMLIFFFIVLDQFLAIAVSYSTRNFKIKRKKHC